MGFFEMNGTLQTPEDRHAGNERNLPAGIGLLNILRLPGIQLWFCRIALALLLPVCRCDCLVPGATAQSRDFGSYESFDSHQRQRDDRDSGYDGTEYASSSKSQDWGRSQDRERENHDLETRRGSGDGTDLGNLNRCGMAPNFSSDLKMSPPVFQSRIYYEGSETLGRVGHEMILKRDILHQLRKFAYLEFMRQRDEAPEKERNRFNDKYFEAIKNEFLANEKIYSQVLEEYICELLFFNDYVVSRSKEEIETQIKQLGKTFENEYMSHLLEQMKCENRDELEDIFKNKLESSLEEEKRLFITQTVSGSWVSYNLGTDQWEPTSHDLRRYYENHRSEYEQQERVRWQKMSVFFSNHPSKADAYDKIVYMGNAVQRAGNAKEREQLFAKVARTDSEDMFASKGGYCDWTQEGDVSSEIINNALFGDRLPVGAMSQILEDKSGLSIICVLERREHGFRPFVDVQEEIVEKIKDDRQKYLKAKYEKELAKRFAVQIYKISSEERRTQMEAMSHEAQSATGRRADEAPY